MKKLIFMFVLTVACGMAISGCKSSTSGRQSRGNTVIQPATGVELPGTVRPGMSAEKGHYPMARIYQMNGDWSDNVPVGMRGSELVSFPSPGDLTAASRPVRLADGYWLDCRGVGGGTAFTRYTYAQYMALPTPPDPKTLIDAIIPGARVTRIVELPFTMQTARADTAAVNALIRDGLPGCLPVYP